MVITDDVIYCRLCICCADAEALPGYGAVPNFLSSSFSSALRVPQFSRNSLSAPALCCVQTLDLRPSESAQQDWTQVQSTYKKWEHIYVWTAAFAMSYWVMVRFSILVLHTALDFEF